MNSKISTPHCLVASAHELTKSISIHSDRDDPKMEGNWGSYVRLLCDPMDHNPGFCEAILLSNCKQGLFPIPPTQDLHRGVDRNDSDLFV